MNHNSNAVLTKESLYAHDWIAYHSGISPESLAQVDLASKRSYSYHQMNHRVGCVAQHLINLGITAGDRVGYLAMNSTDILEMVFGCWRIGAIALALNYRLTAIELKFIIDDAGATIIYYDEALEDVVSELKKITHVKFWIATNGMGKESEYEQALAGVTPLLDKTITQSISEQAMLMYSSGTTGKPKGVIITYEMLFYSALDFSITCNFTSNSVNLAAMPMFHIAGFHLFSCTTMLFGGTTVVMRAFSPEEALDVFNDPKIHVTHFLAVPAIYNALKIHPKNAQTNFSKLEYAIAGAESVPDELVRWWSKRGVKIQEGFGMTESSGGNCLLPKKDVPRKIGSAGKAMMHTEIKIVREDGTDALPDEQGEMLMRGPTITPGYWNRPDANSDSFINGWLKTGDIARMDREGYIYIEDRVKDMYISGGENVYPAEIENVLYQMQEISEVAVIGIPSEKWGEIGCVVAVIKEGQTLDKEKVSEHCKDKLAKFKQPSHLVLLNELPRTATSKVQKFELRELVTNTLS
ncbi:MAG: long-chain fatty acid--CoA ligase [Kangiellaceae bacterium]|nr:long-chain fatty acid--CoA ligase [Kangiellaceae bacterium]